MSVVYSRVWSNMSSKALVPFLVTTFYPRLVSTEDFEVHINGRRSYFGVAGSVTRKKINGTVHYGNPPILIYVPTVSPGIWVILPSVVALSCSVNNLKLMSTFSHRGEVTISDEFLKQIVSGVEDNLLSDTEVCSLIEKLCSYGSALEIAKLISALQYSNIYLSASAYDLLLATTSRENDFELSLEIFRDMLLSSSSLSSGAYFNLARAFSRTDDCTTLLAFADKISELMLMRSLRVFNRMIFAFGGVGQAEKALTIFYHMESLKCFPDLCTYNTVIEILGLLGKVNSILIQVTAMRKDNIAPNIVTYNTLINSFRRLCRFDLCLLYWKDMEKSGIQPDLRTYTAMIDSLGRSGNVEGSLALFHEMKCRHARPSIYIYRSLIDCAKTMGQPKMADSLHKEMISSMPDLVGPKDFNRKKR